MLILAFDTATPAVTVAAADGSDVLAHESVVDARRHGEVLAPSIAMVLAKAGARPEDLTAIAVGTGPGPYTGLRVGLVTARVLGSALGVPVDGVCTLDIIAAEARHAARGGEFIVATDARRREVYWARYAASGERLSEPQVSAPGLVPAGRPVAGEGAVLHPDLGGGGVLEPRFPSAAALAEIAAEHITRGVPPTPPEALYLRRPDAREPGRPKRVTP
ncbi:MAG TPA: tRNA (adenosine(37)-N6)-threonylcarbamoyltransferase complex dimerization subunit type 1 TsaB [Streptosporangiaceae bacterium]|nr:tRNA (adenosine(37)-N6)-threonylcarbamoyltransferase complex dimerization subunit type 1 TsaB [Streptosporangiaceae bacterium]